MLTQRFFAHNPGRYVVCLSLTGVLGCLASSALGAETAELRASDLLAVVVDNAVWKKHHARYNGLAYFSWGKDYENVFHVLYGGFDFENIFDREQEAPAEEDERNGKMMRNCLSSCARSLPFSQTRRWS